MNEETLFAAAIELPAGPDREAFLDRACENDAALRQRLVRLLAAHDLSGMLGQVDPPASDLANNAANVLTVIGPGKSGEAVGTIIAGRYKLLEQIGEGGMGAVWVAEQTQPVRRKVALKLIKPGMDSKTVLSRFEAERQALAVMDHPNIAKVLDGGTTENGRPFFVMEYVKGIAFTKYCDDARLSIAERLALFVPVCQAVQHAHQKGIIHRDLKPGNILICLYDGKPVPKVIDFGLAKAMHQPLTEQTLYTAHGVMMGTPLYMSPEQAELNNLDVDTRTDIYALGVILYELLTGTTPLEKQQLKQAAWHEMLRLIKEVEPPCPSARLSGSGTLPTLAAQRQLEPVKLTRLVRGELDWIVMKCLEKDRSRRYDTTTGLARDVERYLADDVVEARPQSSSYRLRKLVRKHRVALATISAFAVLLIASAGISGILTMRAKRAESTAENRRIEAEANAKTAESNAKDAESLVAVCYDLIWETARARVKAEVHAAALQIDLDIEELKTNKKVGLLRLARFLSTEIDNIKFDFANVPRLAGTRTFFSVDDTDELIALREFATIAVLATGQEFGPMLRPITHDGVQILDSYLNSSGDRVLTRGEDGTTRLWETSTTRQIALLRRADELVVMTGFDPEGNTVFTDSLDGIVRFWDMTNGDFLTQTERRPDRFKLVNCDSSEILAKDQDWFVGRTRLFRGHLMTPTLVEIKRVPDGRAIFYSGSDSVELWNAKNGKVVAEIEMPKIEQNKYHSSYSFNFIGDRPWIAVQEGNSKEKAVRVFSAENGRLIATLQHSVEYPLDGDIPSVSPLGNTVATVSTVGNFKYVYLWDTTSWKMTSITGPVEFIPNTMDGPQIGLIADDLFTISQWDNRIGDSRTGIYRIGMSKPLVQFNGARRFLPEDQILLDSNQIFNMQTWGRLVPPMGRKYHPRLVRLAPDGRFVDNASAFTDTITEKSIPLPGYTKYLPNNGWVVCSGNQSDPLHNQLEIQLLPSPDKLRFPVDLLELWVQVAVRGHLDDGGNYVKMDEPTWEKKRQELVSMPIPYPDFQFPGHVASDRLHWLRQEFENANNTDKPRFAKQLLDRAKAAGDKVEAVRWIEFLAQNLVDTVSTKPLLRSGVLERLRQDRPLDSEIQAAALVRASRLVEDANELNVESWRIVIRRKAEDEEYRRGLRWAEAAVRHETDNSAFVNTLGIAQYRNGLFAEAITTLARSHAAHEKSETGPQASDLAFLAMAHHALGETDKANDCLRQLTALLDAPQWKADAVAMALLEETRQRFAAMP